jgi:hypothetical protein
MPLQSDWTFSSEIRPAWAVHEPGGRVSDQHLRRAPKFVPSPTPRGGAVTGPAAGRHYGWADVPGCAAAAGWLDAGDDADGDGLGLDDAGEGDGLDVDGAVGVGDGLGRRGV